MTKPKRKKRDPLAGLKKKHPGPWKVLIVRSDKKQEGKKRGDFMCCHVLDANGFGVQSDICNIALARAIAKLGAK